MDANERIGVVLYTMPTEFFHDTVSYSPEEFQKCFCVSFENSPTITTENDLQKILYLVDALDKLLPSDWQYEKLIEENKILRDELYKFRKSRYGNFVDHMGKGRSKKNFDLGWYRSLKLVDMTDKEVAELMGMSLSTLSKHKKKELKSFG